MLDEALTVEHASDNIVAEAGIVVAWEAGEFLTVAREGPRVAARSGPTQQAGLLTYVAMAAAEVGDLAAAQPTPGDRRSGARRPAVLDHE